MSEIQIWLSSNRKWFYMDSSIYAKKINKYLEALWLAQSSGINININPASADTRKVTGRSYISGSVDIQS